MHTMKLRTLLIFSAPSYLLSKRMEAMTHTVPDQVLDLAYMAATLPEKKRNG
jgi:hypothetical protein